MSAAGEWTSGRGGRMSLRSVMITVATAMSWIRREEGI